MPTLEQWARTPPGLPAVVLCNGPAEHYRDNVQNVLKLVLVPQAGFEVRRSGTRHTAGPGQLIVLHPGEAHSGGPTQAQSAEWLLLCLPPRRFDDARSRGQVAFHDPAVNPSSLQAGMHGYTGCSNARCRPCVARPHCWSSPRRWPPTLTSQPRRRLRVAATPMFAPPTTIWLLTWIEM